MALDDIDMLFVFVGIVSGIVEWSILSFSGAMAPETVLLDRHGTSGGNVIELVFRREK